MRGQPFIIGPFVGGLNTRDSPLELPLSQTPDAYNIFMDRDGTIRKRNPHAIWGPASEFSGAGANNITSLFTSQQLDKSIVTIGSKVYSHNPTVGTDISAGVIGSGLAWSFVDAPVSGGQGPVYGLPGDLGTTTPRQWTGAGAIANWTALAGTLTAGDFMLYFKNRIIMFGLLVGTNGCGLKASKVGDPRAWDTTLTGTAEAWLTDIEPTDGQKINAMGVVGNYLVVFKQYKTYIVYDLDTGANRPLNTSLGCNAKRTVANSPYGLFFLASDGHVYVTDGTKIEKISDIIGQPMTTESLSATPGMLGDSFVDDSTIVGMPCGFYYKDRYYLSTGATSGTPTTFVYDIPSKTWWRHTMGFSQMAIDPQGQNWVIGGLRKAGATSPVIWRLFAPGQPLNLYQDGNGDPSATTYNAYYMTPPLGPTFYRRKIFEDYMIRRRYHAMRGYVGGTVTVQTTLDPVTPVAPATVASLSSGDVDHPVEQTIYSLGVSNYIQFKFTSTDSNCWCLHPFKIYTQPRTD